MREYGERLGRTRQRIHQLIQAGRIPGARKLKTPGGPPGGVWIIPAKARIKPLTAIKQRA